jgi:hypothetical protein
MNRRDFLVGVVAACIGRAGVRGEADRWRTFEITTRVQIAIGSGPTRLWLPMPLAVAPYQKTLGDTYQITGGGTTMVESEDVDILVANWDEGIEPALTITNRVATTAYAANLATPTVPPLLDTRPLDRFLRTGTPPSPDLKQRADRMTRGAGTDVERARAIFGALTASDGAASGTDPNVTFAELARAAGIPAREVRGLRLDAENATRAQHCRAEAYLTGYGWVPVDAAERTFGAWSDAWVAYNWARNVALPGAKRGSVPFLAYPQAETGGVRLDASAPDAFRYAITIREVT